MNIPGVARTSRPSASVNDATDTYELPEVTIGKDILELVSSAMYVDPMTVYREYIQNAADAVDAARDAGLLGDTEPGRVEIDVDPANRSVRIRDNGCGVPFESFWKKLTAIGGSEKRGTSARGFRGVGRLAGLGYAQELIFRSRVNGERKVSELRWDCRQLRATLRNSNNQVRLTELICAITKLQRLEIQEAPDRFFEVELRGVIRQRNDRLMSLPAITDYLSQVAPVPFSPNFKRGRELTERLEAFLKLDTLNIYIGGNNEPIYRPHRDSLHLQDKSTINFEDLNVAEIPGLDGGLAAVAWVLHHEYEGALPNSGQVKGLRLRVGNIQVGDHSLLEDLFPEPRFNAWSVGEVHIVDRRIVPNGRRDNFEQNNHFGNLLNHLTPTARDIARRCRTSSARRKWIREFQLHHHLSEQNLAILDQGGIGKEAAKRFIEETERAIASMRQVSRKDLLTEGNDARQEIINTMEGRLLQNLKHTDLPDHPMQRLPDEKRSSYEHLFELIYECSVNRVAAKSLIDRIIARVTTS